MNTLQFVSACPNGDSFLNWDRMVYWPFRQSGPSWHYAPDTRSLSDENTDSFLVSNFLRYFVHLHPTHHSSARHRSFLRIDSVMPSLLPLEGGEVTIKGSVLPIHEVLLAGCEGGCCALSFTRVTPTELRVVVPPLPRGFYHLQFFTVQGVRVLCDENQDYFGREGVLVTALEWGKEERVSNRNRNTPASEEEFEEAKPSKWKPGVSSAFLLQDLFAREELFAEEKEVVGSPIFEDMVIVEEEDNTPVEVLAELASACDSLCDVARMYSSPLPQRVDDDNLVGGAYYHPVCVGGVC